MGKKRHDFQPGTLGCHEALHMASFLAHAVSKELCEHKAIAAKPEWKALADAAFDNLFNLYQAIGAEHLPQAAKALGGKGDK